MTTNTATTVTLLTDRLATALRHYRYEADLTQADAAKLLHCSVSRIVRHEAGATCPSVGDLRDLLRCYRVIDEKIMDTQVQIVDSIQSARRRDTRSAPTLPAATQQRLLRTADVLKIFRY
jgi:predicted transcriptional regulator